VSVLSDLNVGESGVVVALDLPDSVQNHLMHMGFVPDSLVTALRRAPAGDPTVYSVDGMEIALRKETASAIQVCLPGSIRLRDFKAKEAPALVGPTGPTGPTGLTESIESIEPIGAIGADR
jgi:ferrous iron transport protein A